MPRSYRPTLTQLLFEHADAVERWFADEHSRGLTKTKLIEHEIYAYDFIVYDNTLHVRSDVYGFIRINAWDRDRGRWVVAEPVLWPIDNSGKRLPFVV